MNDQLTAFVAEALVEDANERLHFICGAMEAYHDWYKVHYARYGEKLKSRAIREFLTKKYRYDEKRFFHGVKRKLAEPPVEISHTGL
jgi:hypothetical protein